MQYNTILAVKGDGVVVVTLNRPDVLNAVNLEMRLEFLDALGGAEIDDDVRAVVVTGAGRAFCSGADISAPRGDMAEFGRQQARTKNMIRQIYEFEKPIIGAINGIAAGDGAQWALAFDLIVASQDARFAFPATRLGIL